jgi:predicted CXXCH cytochrome family protein
MRSIHNVQAATVGGALALLFAGAGTPQEKPTAETDECANQACHASIVDRPVMHRPVERLQCLDCHEYDAPAEHLFGLVVPADELCWECHDPEVDEVVHAPLEDGNCAGCHDPHGSDHELMLVLPVSGGLCLTCHDVPSAEKAYLHGPVAAQACTACHGAHSSPHEMLLANTQPGLCLDCHTETKPSGAAADHRHPPLDQGCDGCHDPHASDIRYQLLGAAPELCFRCHESMKPDLAEAAVVHGPMHDEGGCAVCHLPHYSAQPALLAGPPTDLCLGCHDKPIRSDDGRTLVSLSAVLAENPRRHGPVRDGECAPCHRPHASEHARLLTEEYPATFYAPFEFERYELCFGCHDEDLVMEESGTGVTGFRDGDRNLHWLHVNRDKGRTCRACHEVHASRRPFHIREAVPFGSRSYVIRLDYEQLSDGGSCGPGCHRAKAYHRGDEES